MKPTKVLAGVFCAFLLASPKGAITQGLCTIDTFAGGGTRPIPNDGVPAKEALLGTPYDLVADSAGNIFFTDTTTDQVRVIRPSGTVETFFGPQLISNGSLGDPRGLAIDAQRNLYVADSGRNFILRISPSGTATIIANQFGYNSCRVFTCGDRFDAIDATVPRPHDIAVDSLGNIYVADDSWGPSDVDPTGIRKITPDGKIDSLRRPDGRRLDLYPADAIAVDSQDRLIVANRWGVYRVNPGGNVETVKGASEFLDIVGGIVEDKQSNLYFSEPSFFTYLDQSHRILKLTPEGSLRTIVGLARTLELAGDGGSAPPASIRYPRGLAIDAAGSLLVADAGNQRLRRISGPDSCPSESLPQIKYGGFTSGATFHRVGPAPGLIFSIFGTRLGPKTLQQAGFGPDGRLPTELAGTRVLSDGAPAPLLFSLDSQVGGVVPFAVAQQGRAIVEVVYRGTKSEALLSFGSPTSPGIFTLDTSGSGQAAALNPDGSVNSALRPVKRGAYVALYVTGLGQTNPPGIDGLPNQAPWGLPLQPVRVFLGEYEAEVLFAGAAPGLVAGVYQVNVGIPADLPVAGAVRVALRVGEVSINNATIVVEF